ncbi:hypothetical protein GCM10010376_81650 [Streptomyces violaceusniger]
MLGLGVGSASAFGDVALHEESEFHGGSPPQTNVDLTDRQILIDSGTAGTDRQGPWKATRGRRPYGGCPAGPSPPRPFPLPGAPPLDLEGRGAICRREQSTGQGRRSPRQSPEPPGPRTPGGDEPALSRDQPTGQGAGVRGGTPSPPAPEPPGDDEPTLNRSQPTGQDARVRDGAPVHRTHPRTPADDEPTLNRSQPTGQDARVRDGVPVEGRGGEGKAPICGSAAWLAAGVTVRRGTP